MGIRERFQNQVAFDVPKGTLPGVVEVHDSAYSKGVAVTVLRRR